MVNGFDSARRARLEKRRRAAAVQKEKGRDWKVCPTCAYRISNIACTKWVLPFSEKCGIVENNRRTLQRKLTACCLQNFTSNGGEKYEKDVWQCAYSARVCIRNSSLDQHSGECAVVESELRRLQQPTSTAGISEWREHGRQRCPSAAKLQSTAFTLLPERPIAGFPRRVYARL